MKLATLGSRIVAFAVTSALAFFAVHCGGSAVAGGEDVADVCGDALLFYSPNATCYAPADCCDLGGADLPTHCEAAFPGHPVPVMCMNGDSPVGLDCQHLETSQFQCEWGASTVMCCQTSE